MKMRNLLGIGALAALIGCSYIKNDSEELGTNVNYEPNGYCISTLSKDAVFYHWKNLNYSQLIFRDEANDLCLYDDNNDSSIDLVMDMMDVREYLRKTGPKELFDEADKLLNEYRKALNIDKVHKKWKKMYGGKK